VTAVGETRRSPDRPAGRRGAELVVARAAPPTVRRAGCSGSPSSRASSPRSSGRRSACPTPPWPRPSPCS
jgi:hypothetical protein